MFRALFSAFGLLVLILEVARYINWSKLVSASEVGLFFWDLFGNSRSLLESLIGPLENLGPSKNNA
jgi:hypothetical protein